MASTAPGRDNWDNHTVHEVLMSIAPVRGVPACRCAYLLFVRPPNECPTCRRPIDQVRGAGRGGGRNNSPRRHLLQPCAAQAGHCLVLPAQAHGRMYTSVVKFTVLYGPAGSCRPVGPCLLQVVEVEPVAPVGQVANVK